MTSIFTVVMDDGDDANELDSFSTHQEALNYLKQQVHVGTIQTNGIRLKKDLQWLLQRMAWS